MPHNFFKSTLMSLITLSYFILSSAAAIEEIDAIAVIVNEDIISKQQINSRLADFTRQMKLQKQNLPPEKLLRKQVVERMILDSIQMQQAKAQGIRIDDLGLNSALESIANKNRTTLDKMRRMLESQGINFATYREQIRKDMIIRQLQQRMIYSKVRVSEQEIDIFLEQQKKSGKAANDSYRLSHILIATPEAASPEEVKLALLKANKVIGLLKSKSFSDIALEFSDGRNALKGGDLGWREAAQLPPLFLNAARKLSKGDISPALRSAGGFHILKLVDKKTQTHIIKQTHARHILIKTDEITNDQAAEKQLTEIKTQLENNADFAQLAAEFSQDPGSKSNGGDLGWAKEGSFVPKFTEVMNSLEVNQISKPFKSQFGWHILQVLGRRQQDDTQQLIRKKAQMAIQNRKAEEQLQLWIRRARDEAYVVFLSEVSQ